MLRRTIAVALACALALASTPRHAAATRLAVDLWLDRGDAAVYQPGEALGIRTHLSQDAYLLVYEIDSQGYVNELYPLSGRSGYVDGRKDLTIPPADAKVDLVAQDPVGEGYVVVLASSAPFHDMPWYLRPYDAAAEGAGYEGDTPPEEQGVTADGRIVGDPFVAMEKIRRRVLATPEDESSFATEYTSFYVHERVKYPRYLCDDCHRPAYWTWWPGYDPYFASCSAFDFRVNWGWSWGPSYWTGCVPYYVYQPRPGCPPGTAPGPGITYSSWLGWNKWNALWGGKLKNKAASAPPGYVGPDRYRAGRAAGVSGRFDPPGYVTAANTSPMLRGNRGMPYGRLGDTGRQGGMLDTHSGTNGATNGVNGQSGTRPQIGASRGGERPIGRPVWTPSSSGSSEPRGQVYRPRETPQRYETPPHDFHPAPSAPAAPAPRVSPPAPPQPSRPAPAAPSHPAPAPPTKEAGDQGGGHHGR